MCAQRLKNVYTFFGCRSFWNAQKKNHAGRAARVHCLTMRGKSIWTNDEIFIYESFFFFTCLIWLLWRAIILVGSRSRKRNGGYSGGDIRFSVDNQSHGLILQPIEIIRQFVRPDLGLLAFLRLQKASLLLLQAIPQHENLGHSCSDSFAWLREMFPKTLFLFLSFFSPSRLIFSRSLVNARTLLVILLFFCLRSTRFCPNTSRSFRNS